MAAHIFNVTKPFYNFWELLNTVSQFVIALYRVKIIMAWITDCMTWIIFTGLPFPFSAFRERNKYHIFEKAFDSHTSEMHSCSTSFRLIQYADILVTLYKCGLIIFHLFSLPALFPLFKVKEASLTMKMILLRYFIVNLVVRLVFECFTSQEDQVLISPLCPISLL